MYNGIINIYKEAGFTSHDVVAKMRGILKQKKIGHTGTLDPQAVGVLPVCLGTGTKLCDMLTDRDKEYEAVLLLGVATDTQDTTGKILEEKEVTAEEEAVRKAILSFQGEYDQIPPMYSALKIEGKKLYELAREGREVERASRRVTVYKIEVLDMELPRVKLRVSCSKGTYIRTLCHDIGRLLGCGGAMEFLERTRVGGFTARQAVTLTELEQLAREGRTAEKVLSVDKVFERLPALHVRKEYTGLIENGNPFAGPQAAEEIPCMAGARVRVYDTDGKFYGIYEYDPEKRRMKPVKMFLEAKAT